MGLPWGVAMVTLKADDVRVQAWMKDARWTPTEPQ